MLSDLLVLPEKALETHFDNAKNCFTEYFGAHFRSAEPAVTENNRDLGQLKPVFPGSKLHLYLKSVAAKADLVQVYDFQHPSFIAFKPGSGIAHGNPQHYPHIYRSIV